MSTDPDTDREELYRRSYLYAALHDSFAPIEALSWAAGGQPPEDVHLTAEIMSLLRPHCTPDPTAEPGRTTWIMRPAARHYALDETRLERDTVATFDTDLARARLGKGAFAPEALDARIDAGDPAPDLSHIAGTLDRAGPDAPGAGRVAALRALMNQASTARRTDALLARGFEGREAELTAIADAIAEPQATPPLRAVTISGLAGIGKSSLLDYAIERARLAVSPVVIRLDFDRAGLDLRDARSFYDEISRQVGDALPHRAGDLRDLRLATTPRQVSLASPAETQGPPLDRLILAVAQAVNAEARTLLIALDTMEALRAEGESRIELLFERLDRLCHAGLARIVIVAAGRGRFMDPAPDRIRGKRLVLGGLENHAAKALLAGENVPEMLWSDILRLAGGNPLFLRLAARAAAGGALDTRDLPDGAPPEAVADVLFRAILSRVPQDLRQLAAMGLLLREISRDSLAEVLVPAIAPDIGAKDLETSFSALAGHVWLVTHDENAGLLRYNDDVRRAFLPLIHADAPDLCADVHARAATYFDRTGRPDLALYHRLQLMRAGRSAPEIISGVAQRLPPGAADDLIPGARDVLRQAQGLRSDFARTGMRQTDPTANTPQATRSVTTEERALTGDGPLIRFDTARDRLLMTDDPDGSRPDPRAVQDLARSLASHDLREAEFILQNGMSGVMPAGSPAARLLLCHLWLSGRWSSARRLFRAQPADALDTALKTAPALQGRILLDMEAEFRFDTLVARLRRDPDLAANAVIARLDAGRAGLAGGALDMALVTALPERDLPKQDLDIALGLLAQHGGDDWQAKERLHHVARAAMNRSGIYRDPRTKTGSDPEMDMRDLAVLNPYARTQMAILLRTPRGALAEFLSQAHALPLEAARHTHAWTGKPEIVLPDHYATPRDLLRAFHVAGLAAEWAEGFTLFNPVADLPLLAQGTERWRRMSAGDWPYGRSRPATWPERPPPDPVTRARAQALLDADEPGQAARARLHFWSRPTHTPEAAARHLERRFKARYQACLDALPREAGPQERLDLALRLFHEADVTSVAAAPLAVLAALAEPTTRAFLPPY